MTTGPGIMDHRCLGNEYHGNKRHDVQCHDNQYYDNQCHGHQRHDIQCREALLHLDKEWRDGEERKGFPAAEADRA